MRKIGAYILGVFLLLLLGSALLHPSLLVLADWLGPMLGSPIYGAMTMAFLMIADPITYPILFIIWLAVAVSVGAVIRRRLGAILVGLLVWLTMIPISASMVFSMASRIQEASQEMTGPLGGLPPIPKELNLSTIFSAPIIGDVAKKALLSIGSEVNGQQLAEQILSSVALGVASKPLIMIVGVLIGVELGRLAQKRSIGGWSLGGKTSAKTVATLVILCVCVSTLVAPVSALQLGSGDYFEAIIGTTDERGRAYVGDLFVNTNPSYSGLGVSSSDAEGLAAAVVVSQEGLVDEFGQSLAENSQMGDMSSLLNFLLPTFAVVVYVDVQKDVAAQRSISVSRALSTIYNVDLSQLTTFSFKPGENDTEYNPTITVSLFQSSTDFSILADNYLTRFSQRGGFVDTMTLAVANGHLIPDKVDSSASGSVFAAGFVNVDTLKAYIPQDDVSEEISGLFQSLSGPIDFAGSVSFWGRGDQPSSPVGTVDILRLLGVNDTPSYARDSSLSLLVTFTPLAEDSGDQPRIHLSTNAVLTSDEVDSLTNFLEQMGYIPDIHQGSPSVADFTFDVPTQALPPNVVVTKTVTDGTPTTVTIAVHNKDTKPLTNVVVDDSSSLGYYEGTDLVSGTPATTWGLINPGETQTLTYSIRLDDLGIYTMSSAVVSYSVGGESFRDASNSAETKPNRPFPLLMPFEIVVLTWMTGSQLLDMVTGRGVIVMSVFTLAFVLLIVWEGVKSYKRWKGGKEVSVAPQVSGGDTPATPL